MTCGRSTPTGPRYARAAAALGAAAALFALPAAVRADALPVATAAVVGITAPPPATSDEILVRHVASATTADVAGALADAGVTYERPLPLAGVDLVWADGSRQDALQALRADPDVLWAEPNQPVHAATNDSYWGLQYALSNTGQGDGTPDADVDAPEAWSVTQGAGVTVGVVDTGVDALHPDLAGQIVTGKNFVAGSSGTADGDGHGTHVSGIIAALSNNEVGVSGVAPQAKVEPLRALDDTGRGTTASVAAAFAYAGTQKLRVVNASLGSPSPSQAEQQAIATASSTLFVVAAGNDGANVDAGSPTYPCAYSLPNVLCVGASDERDEPASFSNTGATSVDLFAPGVRIVSTWLTSQANPYEYESGTSMASPMTAAAVALVAAAHPAYTPAQLKATILAAVDHPQALAGLSATGGRLNAARALGVNVGDDGSPPPQVTGLVATGGDSRVDLQWTASAARDLDHYDVYRLVTGGYALQGEAPATSVGITDLTPGATESFRVTAVDDSGGESVPSAIATAVVQPVPPDGSEPAPAGSDAVAAPGAAPVPAAAAAPAGPAIMPDLTTADWGRDGSAATAAADPRISRVRVVVAKRQPRAISFRLWGASRVVVTAQRRSGGSRATVTRTLAYDPGDHLLAIGRRTSAIHLGRGTWRVTLTTTTSHAAVTIRVT